MSLSAVFTRHIRVKNSDDLKADKIKLENEKQSLMGDISKLEIELRDLAIETDKLDFYPGFLNFGKITEERFMKFIEELDKQIEELNKKMEKLNKKRTELMKQIETLHKSRNELLNDLITIGDFKKEHFPRHETYLQKQTEYENSMKKITKKKEEKEKTLKNVLQKLNIINEALRKAQAISQHKKALPPSRRSLRLANRKGGYKTRRHIKR